MKTYYWLAIIVILTALSSCSTSRPKSMLEFYYSVPSRERVLAFSEAPPLFRSKEYKEIQRKELLEGLK